jgi:hypothetical protein
MIAASNLTIGPTIIDGDKLEDDYVVREDGYGCGRIRLGFVAGPEQKWLRYINPPVGPTRNATADTLQQAKEQWKAAWASVRPSMTDAQVAYWHELEDGVRKRFGGSSN